MKKKTQLYKSPCNHTIIFYDYSTLQLKKFIYPTKSSKKSSHVSKQLQKQMTLSNYIAEKA